MTYAELETIFSQWLYFENEPNELLVSVATILANRLDSVPIWMFLVGPSSCLKSGILRTMDGAREIKSLSTLNQYALLSAYKDKKGKTFSILPEINNKTLVIKDFTTILGMRRETRNEIFGQFRDAYDGYISRATGTGEVSYRSKFGLLAGCTMAIETMRSAENQLGERFLYFKNTQPDSEAVYTRIASNIGHDSQMNTELKAAMNTFLNDATVPGAVEVSSEMTLVLSRWSQRIVMLRTSVNRDQYTRQIMVPVSQTEYGGRLVTQLLTLYFSIRELVEEARAMRVIRMIVLDAIPLIRQLTIRGIVAGHTTSRALSEYVKVSHTTILRTIEELKFLNILDEGNNVVEAFRVFIEETT